MTRSNRVKHALGLLPQLSRQLADYAGRKRVSQAAVVEVALASFLSPDGSERLEAAFSRRLDLISRQLDRLGYHVDVGTEALTLYLRRWFTVTAASSGPESAAAHAEVEKRVAFFIEALARRMETGRLLHDELVRGDEAARHILGKDAPGTK
ncbi:CopG family transcriptional regulator [Porphyrobacter sp. TH134]|uniref:CopG family transcriptional regulator n=1 Tax=Porphyrobacter sp. TH134 TaxID=2067450 RepID=UPI000C7D309B|nr:CopG family transcriptional regulator [Porphyrobacter sp. TH134]PLK22695.1 CopG family transcriptional regulator [Porphyrobacter sp. TH134]